MVVVGRIHRRGLEMCAWIHVERRGGDMGALHYRTSKAARIEEQRTNASGVLAAAACAI